MTKEQFNLIEDIALRADEMRIIMFSRMTLVMDLEYATKQFNLRLNDFLNANDFDFTHDILGIQHNFNRKTKKMENYFVPRFSGRE